MKIKITLIFLLTSLFVKAQTPIEEWAARYNNSQANGTDVFLDMVVDANGNSYACGYSNGQTTGVDIVVAKYELDGDTAWVYRYNNSQANGEDKAVAIALTNNNDVVITGYSEGQTTGRDMITLRLSGTSGAIQNGWPKIIDGSDNGADYGADVAVRQTDNLIVVCGTQSASSGHLQPILISYDLAGNINWNGAQEAHNTYEHENLFCEFFNNGNIALISFYIWGGDNIAASFDIINGANGISVAEGYIDNQNIPYLFQHTYPTDFYMMGGTTGYLLFTWKDNFNGGDGYGVSKVTSTSDQYLVAAQYRVFDQAGGYPSSVIANSNKIFIAGYEDVNPFSPVDLNGFLDAYNQTDPLGTSAWSENYGNTQEDKFLDITIDNATNANIYVTGYSTTNSNRNIVNAKYDNNGVLVWDTVHYNTANNGLDEAYIISGKGTNGLVSDGSLWVAGQSEGTNEDGIVIKYCVPPTVTLAAQSDVCEEISAFALSGGSPAGGTYSGTGVTNNMFDPGAAGPGTHTIKYTYTNQNGCSDFDEKDIIVHPTPPVPTVTASGPLQFCDGYTVTLSAPSNYQYVWSPETATTQSLTVDASGSYTVTVIDQYTCRNTSTATAVTVYANPVVNITGTNYFCSGSSTTLMANAQAGSGSITGYQWYLNANNIGGANSSTYLASQVGNYTVTVTNSNTCTTTSNAVSVTEAFPPSTPVITASGNLEFCAGEDVILSTNGSNCNGCTFQWKRGNVNVGAGLNYTATQAGSYTVTASNNCGTEVSAAVVVTVNPLPIASVGNDQTICSGESIVLTNSGTGVCSWLPTTALSDVDSCVTTASPTSDITYILTATDTVTGCINKDTVNITVISGQAPTPQFTFDYSQPGGPTVTFDLTNQDDYDNVTWDFGDGSNTSTTIDPLHQFSPNGDYIVTVTGCITCTDTVICSSSQQLVPITVGISEHDKFPVIIYPNPSTQNFTIETTLLSSTTIQTEIKNTLGQMVYTLNEEANSGLYKKTIDVNLSPGTYFIQLRAEEEVVTKKFVKQ